MLTVSKSSTLSQANTAPHQTAVLSSKIFDRDTTLRQQKFQNRSSTVQQSGSFTTSRNTRQVSRVFVLQGRNAFAVKIDGNGTPSTTGVRQMHNGGAWEFFNNGQFRFTPAGLGVVARTDLFPIVGTYRSTNNGIRFSGSRSSSNLTSRNAAAIGGNIVVRNGAIRASVIQRTVTINAAVVNGTPFGNTIDRTVKIDMNMVRIA